MEYWRGRMDWPLDSDWKCETCDTNCGLEWGLVHAQCRCNQCHTQYYMRADNKERTVLSTPRCMLIDEYREPIKQAWQELQVPIDELTDSQFERYLGGN